MTNELLHLPPRFNQFQENLRDRAILTLRWKDLSREGKEKLATTIKRYSNLQTIRNSPKASVENIILVLDTTNPILEQTCRNRWSFNGGTLSSRRNLEGISLLINQTLQLRRTSPRWREYFLAITGWDNYDFASETANNVIEHLATDYIRTHQNEDLDLRGEEEDNTAEISISDVSRASQQASRRNH